MTRDSTARSRPLSRRAWPLVPLLVLTGAWMVATFMPTDSPDDLIATRQTWTVMGTVLEATVYRPARSNTLARADLETVHTAVLEVDQLMSLYRQDSELVALNARSGMGPIKISGPHLPGSSGLPTLQSTIAGALDVTIQPQNNLFLPALLSRDPLASESKLLYVIVMQQVKEIYGRENGWVHFSEHIEPRLAAGSRPFTHLDV